MEKYGGENGSKGNVEGKREKERNGGVRNGMGE